MNKLRYISKKEVARKLGISSSTVTRWAKAKVIPMPFKLGPNKIVWDKTELENVIEEKKKQRGFFGHKPERGEKNVN